MKLKNSDSKYLALNQILDLSKYLITQWLRENVYLSKGIADNGRLNRLFY